MSSPLSTEESTKQNARAMNQRQMKPEKCPLGKTQRRRLWVNLRKYCDDLFAAGFPDTHRFEPPQHAVAMFAELGLRHPRNPRALRKFYDNFIPRCGHLVENGTNEKKRKWEPNPGCPSSNGSQPPTQRTRYMSSQASGRRSPPPARMPTQQQIQGMQAPQAQAQQQMQATQARPAQAQMAQQQQMAMPSVPTMPTHTQQIDQISRWLASNTFEVPMPSSLRGVPINRLRTRRDGLNILGPNYNLQNMRVQQPSVLAQRRFIVGNTLICLFDDSFVVRHETLTAVFEEIQHVKQQLTLRD